MMTVQKRNLLVKLAILPIVFGFLLFSLFIFPCCASETGTNLLHPVAGLRPAYSDYAAFIAGIPTPPTTLGEYQSRPAWTRFACSLDRSWQKYVRKQLTPMRRWASSRLAAPISSRLTVFYPFSGPDFINAYTLFPRARAYILIALQPVGCIPRFRAMNRDEFDSFFADLRQSLHDLLSVGYFTSARMRSTLEGEKVKGVLPVLMFSLGRENARVLDVERWFMEPDGTIVKAPPFYRGKPAPAGAIPGVRIVFQSERSYGRPQTLYYFRLNLHDSTFRRNSHFIAFLKSFGPLITFMKSDSYVMFDPHTSLARQFVLDQSRYVLQDDSGIPFKYFAPSLWNLRLYGAYKKPIKANTANLLLAIKK